MIKLISFDLDGTLVDNAGLDIFFWYEEVPRLYAEKNGLPLAAAKEKVLAEYDSVGRHHVDWYKPAYWFARFGLRESHARIIRDLRANVRLFPDVLPALRALHRTHRLAVLTNSTHDFVTFKIEAEGLREHFDGVFSAVDDFGMVKKDADAYRKLAEKCRVHPSEAVHIGDDWEFDYLAPKQLGMHAFYLDRKKEKKKTEGIVWDLGEFAKKVRGLYHP